MFKNTIAYYYVA